MRVEVDDFGCTAKAHREEPQPVTDLHPHAAQNSERDAESGPSLIVVPPGTVPAAE